MSSSLLLPRFVADFVGVGAGVAKLIFGALTGVVGTVGTVGTGPETGRFKSPPGPLAVWRSLKLFFLRHLSGVYTSDFCAKTHTTGI